jgi:hypothetical protein
MVIVDIRGGDLFSIAESDWTVINKRVGQASLLSLIAGSVSQTLPGFGALAAACTTWRSRTFPDIDRTARATADGCDQAIREFSAVNQGLEALPDDAALPSDLAGRAREAIDHWAATASGLSGRFATLTPEVRDFHTANFTVDAQISVYQNRLGPLWKPVAAQTLAVNNATGQILGIWQAITDDLRQITARPVTITTPFLTSLQIGAALNSWRNLRGKALAFAGMVPGQERFLSGAWLAAA